MEDARVDDKSTVKDPREKDFEYYLRFGRLWEILCVIALALSVILLWHGLKSNDGLETLGAIILFGLGIGFFFAAVRCAVKSELALDRFTSQSLYLISEHRIRTLEQVRAPEDVTEFLKTLQYHPIPFTQDGLLGRLRTELGSERTKEIKDLVLKYTRLDEEPKLEITNPLELSPTSG